MSQIYVVVEDGLVQTIYSTDPKVEVTLCDLDDFETKKETEALIQVVRATTHQVY